MGLGSHAWLLIPLLLVVLIIWGPGKLPDIGSGMGRAIREFRNASQETKDSVSNAMSQPAPSVAPPDHATAPVVTPPAVTTAPSSDATGTNQ